MNYPHIFLYHQLIQNQTCGLQLWLLPFLAVVPAIKTVIPHIVQISGFLHLAFQIAVYFFRGLIAWGRAAQTLLQKATGSSQLAMLAAVGTRSLWLLRSLKFLVASGRAGTVGGECHLKACVVLISVIRVFL